MMSTQTNAQTNVVNLTIDGRAVTVPKGTTVYQASKQLGIDIPIFCYQDRMPPFGACRMCLVEVEKMPKLQTSCTLEATEGMVVKTMSATAVKGREDILEFLLINHPLDCPICDRGGECPLQEHAYNHGPGLSRFFEEKRHFKKPIPLGPVLMLDRERCIICARCTRFGELIAGDHALEFIDRGYKTEVGTPDGQPVDSKFIGNTIMICPVGALTSQVYRFRARPWDNDATPSTCTLCPVGCSMFLDSRDGEIMRTRSQENKDVNDIWMCDKGWFGYEFSSSEDRLDKPLIRRNGKLVIASWDEAIGLVAENIQTAKANGKLAGLGGNPLTVEENYLFQKLMRDGAGVNNIDHRVGTPILSPDEEGLPAGMEISLGDCENLSYAFILGLDITEEFPVAWLRLKQAINHGAEISFIGHYAPEITPFMKQTLLHAPGQELETLKALEPQLSAYAKSGKKGALFIGSQYLASANRSTILSTLTQLCQKIPNLSLNIMEGQGNSVGARLAGMLPTRGPLGESIVKPGLNAVQIIETAARDGWDYLHIAGANPAKKYPGKMWNDLRSKLKFLVVQDIFLTETAQQADVVLPTYCFVEKGGNFVNIEGRAQPLLPGKELPQGICSDAEIFMKIAQKLNIPLSIDPSFMGKIKQGRPGTRKEKITPTQKQNSPASNGNLRATFAPALFDHGVRMNHNSHVIQLVKEPRIRLNTSEAAKRNIKEGDKVNVSANGNTISGIIKVDDLVAEGTVVLPLGFPEIPVHELGTNLLNGLVINLTKVEPNKELKC
jgi:NADH-quinone oxidoreductase subunit G